MSGALDFLSDETILSIHDAFGKDFWVRVLENNGAEIQPLQQDIRFKGKLNTETMNFQFLHGEEERAQETFTVIANILDRNMYKHTPFLNHTGNAKGFRFTFDPGLIRFTFQPEAMPGLTELARRGTYLDSIREMVGTLDSDPIVGDVVYLLDKKKISLLDTLRAVRVAIREHAEGSCSDAKMAEIFERALGKAEGSTETSIPNAVAALEKEVHDDPVFGIHQPTIDKLKALQEHIQKVAAHIREQEILAKRERDALMGSLKH